MTTVNEIELTFNFSRGDDGYKSIRDSFDPADSSLITVIEERRDEMLDELNDEVVDGDDEWEFVDWDVKDYDDDYTNPDDFSDLNDYGEYCENVEKFGEAFHLRYEDIGEITACDFEDSYNGCWSSEEEFVQNLISECYDFTVPPFVHVDWERTARDVMMDHSSYEGNDGYHIFHDC